jgi:hypothetical protein
MADMADKESIMKMNIFLKVLLLSIITVGFAQAESIVMKSTIYGMEALSDKDIATHGEVVSQILQKYQWPMCQDSELTPEEKHELLSPEGNEERFLEQKLNGVIPTSERDNFEFVVIFVPTTLYELFCTAEILRFYNKKTKTFFAQLCLSTTGKDFINLEPALNSSSSALATKIELESYDRQFHELRDSQLQSKYPILESYRLFALQLFKYHPPLEMAATKDYFAMHLEQQSIYLAYYFIRKIIKEIDSSDGLLSFLEKGKTQLQFFKSERYIGIIESYIKKEFKAHKQNQVLLVRGTSIFDCTIGNSNNKLVASTMRDQTMKPYSISLGSSLLTGIIHESDVCPYTYLRIHNHEKEKVIGYILFVSKSTYYKNRNNKLLFILPLSTMANLNSRTPYSHPRVTAATTEDTSTTCEVFGIYYTGSQKIKDSSEVLLVRRDPLEHASLFFKYFVDHHEVICNSSLLPKEVKQTEKEILHNQCKAFVETRALLNDRATARITTLARHLATTKK